MVDEGIEILIFTREVRTKTHFIIPYWLDVFLYHYCKIICMDGTMHKKRSYIQSALFYIGCVKKEAKIIYKYKFDRSQVWPRSSLVAVKLSRFRTNLLQLSLINTGVINFTSRVTQLLKWNNAFPTRFTRIPLALHVRVNYW